MMQKTHTDDAEPMCAGRRRCGAPCRARGERCALWYAVGPISYQSPMASSCVLGSNKHAAVASAWSAAGLWSSSVSARMLSWTTHGHRVDGDA